MFGNSPLVESNQDSIHDNLEQVVKKHLDSSYQQTIREHGRAAFERLDRAVKESGCSVILDSGCGTGESSVNLARANPDCLVIGIDKSEVRASKFESNLPENLILERADLTDIWALITDWPIKKHYLIYPNPWPKKKHLMRRWHGHPLFPKMLSLAPEVELRTNWRIYAEEFACSVELLKGAKPEVEEFSPTEPISNFEKKYLESGHSLFRVIN